MLDEVYQNCYEEIRISTMIKIFLGRECTCCATSSSKISLGLMRRKKQILLGLEIS